MNTFDYALLVKDLATHNRISKLQKIKAILFWLIFPIVLIGRLGDIPEINGFAAILIASVSLFYIIGELIYNVIFFAYVDRCRKSQTFFQNEEALISLNQKYDVHFRSVKKIIVVCTLFAAIGFILLIVFAAIGSATDKTIFVALYLIGFLIFLVAILIAAIVSSVKSSKFTKIAACEIEELNNYFNQLKGLSPEQIAKKNSNTLTNVYAAQKSLTYLYPNEDIRKRIQKLSYLLLIPVLIISGICGGVGAFAALDDKLNLLYISLAALIVLTAVAITTFTQVNKKVIKSQRKIFESDMERYKFHIELADITKRNQTKMSILTIISLFAVALVGTIIGVAMDEVTALKMGILIFACLIFWLFIIFPIIILNTKRYRVRASLIEQQIDNHNNTYLQPFEFDNIQASPDVQSPTSENENQI